MKTCKGCGESKPFTEFPGNGGGTYKARCKPCYNKQTAEWRENKADKDRLRQQWREASKKNHTFDKRRVKTLAKYGLTIEQYDAMWNEQGGKCKICRQELKLVVDHCHNSNAVRGLLCDRCNVGLGCFGDDVDRLRAAVLYLSLDAPEVEWNPAYQ